MTSSILILLLHVVSFIAADWIRLPSILPTKTPPAAVATIFSSSHSQDVPKVVFKLAPPPDSDILSSETMSSIFSYRPTTEPTEFPSSTKKSYIRKHFHTTATSKVVNFLANVSNLMDHNEFMEPIVLHQQNKKTSNVRFYNKTVAMNVIPLKANQFINDEMEFTAEEEKDEDDDDGVTITVDDGNNSSVDEGGYEADDELDDYYYDDDDELNKFPQPYKNKKIPTSTTEIPKTHKKSRDKVSNVQRRMQILQKSPRKPFPNINFPTFINFVKKIQESFAMRTAKSIGEKIKMLMSFRDRLMLAINQQIKSLWVKQPRVTKTKKRGKRTLGGGGGGGGWMEHGSSNAMDFPSAEGALLSICFLTFAVFLIKLVLQVIQTIKMKKAMWATQMMSNTGGTETVVIKRRNERAIQNDEDYYYLAKTLDSIHNLKIH